MKYVRKFAGWILLTELVLAAVLLTGLFVPLPGHVEFKIVESGSMEPAVPVGSVVVVVPSAQYAVGDIITFGDDTRKRIPTTHRVAGIEREGGATRFVTKGDANEEADNSRTSYGEVIGRVVLTVPRLGYVLDFARSRNGFTSMVVVPAALVVLDELITIGGTVFAMRRKRSVGEDPANEGKRQRARRPQQPRAPQPAYSYRQSRAHEQVRAGIDGCRVILRPV